MTRMLVLGCGGFLGAPVAARLGELPGVQVLRGARSAGGGRAAGPRPDLVADLADVQVDFLAVQLTALRPDVVVNCAGLTAGSASRLCAVNAQGAAVLGEAMALAVPSARLVHLGSAAEYGPGEPGTSLGESAPPRPAGLYGAAKLAGTLAVAAARLDAVVLRVFNPVGAGAPVSGLPGRLAAALRAAPRDGTVRTGGLGAYRDFVDVTDVAEAVALAATAPGRLPPVLNVGSGRATEVRDLVHELAGISGFTGRIEESGAGSERSAATSWVRADITLAGTALGWRPARTLRDSLTDLWSARAGAPA